MITEKLKPIVKGMILHLPAVKSLRSKRTGGSIHSSYCYTVWLRHLINWYSVRGDVPKKVAELGPGDSLGIALSALLSGSESAIALEVDKYGSVDKNIKIFDELVEMFRNKAPIPDQHEYPLVIPYLETYDFPSHIITDEILEKSLTEYRINAIREELKDVYNPDNNYIKYHIPWDSEDVIDIETIDFVYSQAVMEHVEDVEGTYNSMYKWLKVGGLTSHSIDFKSHGITNSWNGYRMLSEFEWKIVKGGRAFLINRVPYSTHVELQKKLNLKILINIPYKSENKIPHRQLSKKFKNLSNEDMTTSEAFIMSMKV